MVLVCISGTRIVVNDDNNLIDYFIPFEKPEQKKLNKEESYSLLTTKYNFKKTIIIVSSTKEQIYTEVKKECINLNIF